MLKSQDVLVLLKLVALRRAREQSKQSAVQNPAYDWQGWEPDADSKAIEAIALDDLAQDLFSVRSLEASLGLSKSEISHSLRRSMESGLAIRARQSGKPAANTKALYDIIVYALRYVFPAKLGPVVRGIPAGVDAPVFDQLLHSAGEQAYVWADPQGKVQGHSIAPLYRSVPHAVRRDPDLYALLALVDAIRLGRPREGAVAAKELKQRMGLA